MDGWEKFNETSLLEKEDFCSHLNIEDINDADYAHAKRVCKGLKSDTLLLANVFDNFRNMCLEI